MRLITTIFILIVLGNSVFSQSINDLQKKKSEAAKEIEYTRRLLSDVQKSEKSSLGKLRLINGQISSRNTIISSINNEMQVYEEFIRLNEEVIEMLKNDMEEIKKEYAELIRMSYKNKNTRDEILFFLSADNINQAYRRYLYLKRYTSFRQKQAEIIGAVQSVLNENSLRLAQFKNQKSLLAGETQKEAQKLAEEKKLQNSELQKLKSRQQNLRQTLNQQRKVEQQLEREIQKIIEEEAKRSRAAGGAGFALTPEQKLAGDNFSQNKHRLPWPVERGIITEQFGEHRHPVLTNVMVKNNGINIATEIGANVRAIFNGEVSRVFGISGGNTAVIIRHGKYLSVYSNLREVVVKKGDKVAIKQNIGTVFSDLEEGKSELKFQIWYESQKLDPEDWIVK